MEGGKLNVVAEKVGQPLMQQGRFTKGKDEKMKEGNKEQMRGEHNKKNLR